MQIFICEDDLLQRRQMEVIVKDYIAATDCDIELALSTDNPTVLLDYLSTHQQKKGFYILDVDLQHEMSGIILASHIRKADMNAKIVFVTAHGDRSHLTFHYKVEAMDYILKDNPEDVRQKVHDCIALSFARYKNGFSQKDYFQLKIDNKILNIPFTDIMFFESHHISHKLILHTTNNRFDFYSSLNEVSETHPNFFRCHQSYVVNTKNIKRVSSTKKEVEMTNGKIALVAVRKIKKLLEAIR